MRRPRSAPYVAAACAVLLLLPAAAAVPAAAATSQAQPAHGRGALVSADPLYSLADPGDVAAELRAGGFDAGAVRYGVDAYRLDYRTVDPHGRPTRASGLLVLPRGKEGRLRAVSFAHGTGSHKSDAPSMQRHGFMEGTPEKLDDLLTDEGMRLLDQPTGEFAAALRTASGVCDGWAPKAPTRLYLAVGDEQAAVENTAYCRAGLERGRAEVPVVDVGPVDHQNSRHLGSNVAATASIVRWLRTLP
ncbi:hypothetical protein ACH4TX_06815 [Streptomyces sp. NPDC021098]|uniref:hypothetical protein n=1 Tax=unclassified Streptomyces TaxID=2593676 RepID=UPI0037B41BEB